MKKIKALLLFSFLIICQDLFSQTNSYFENGFYEGYKKSLIDEGIVGEYREYADSRKCNSKNVYVNDKQANEKLYADGYRCGVSQGLNAILLIKKKSEVSVKGYNNNSVSDIQSRIDDLKTKITNSSQSQKAAINAQISGLEQQKSNLLISKKSEKQVIEQQNQDYLNAQKRNLNETQRNQDYQQTQLALQQLKIQQENSRQNFQNEINNSINSLSSSMQNMAMMQIVNNLKARQFTIDNFARENQQKIEKIISIHSSIPKENFKRNLNGTFKAYYVSNKKYCYAPNNDLSYVEDCYISVQNNVITNVYMFGNKEIENTLPSQYPENSTLNNGLVKYINLDNLETFNILLIEPYVKNVDSNLSLKENNVGYITLWSSNKDDEGKTVYVQELYDNYTKLNREVVVKIQYAKNEKEIKANPNVLKTPFNLNYTLFYLGEVTNTPYGRIPLATKISDPKENNKELDVNEHRFIQVKKYRE